MSSRTPRIGRGVASARGSCLLVPVVIDAGSWWRRPSGQPTHVVARTSTTATASSPATKCASCGVPVGKIDTIEPQPQRVKITLLVRRQVQGARRRQGRDPVADAGDARAIQLTPAYTGGPSDGATARSSPRTAPRCRWSGTTCATNCRS